jgi:hypothetical protein
MAPDRAARGVTFDDVRAMALALPGAVEGPCYGTPAYRVANKLFARHHQDGESLVVRISIFERPYLLDAEPDVFYLTDHYRPWPWVLLRLAAATPERLRLALEEAWRMEAPKRLIAQLDARSGSPQGS